jgi:hypothetical protein
LLIEPQPVFDQVSRELGYHFPLLSMQTRESLRAVWAAS